MQHQFGSCIFGPPFRGGRHSLASCHLLAANQGVFVLFVFACLGPIFDRQDFITVAVRIKIGANMNLAAANPGSSSAERMATLPSDWVVKFRFTALPDFRLF